MSGARPWKLSSRIGLGVLSALMFACFISLPWSLGEAARTTEDGSIVRGPRFDMQDGLARQLPPFWAPHRAEERERLDKIADREAWIALAAARGTSAESLRNSAEAQPDEAAVDGARPKYVLGADLLGRDLLVRCLAGGGISLGIGLAAAIISVCIGTAFGAISGFVGGRTDAFMMRFVDVLFGLPYVLLVVLLSVAGDAVLQRWQHAGVGHAAAQREAFVAQALADVPQDAPDRAAKAERAAADALAAIGTGELAPALVQALSIFTLLIAIGGISWLTMARVIRNQVLSLMAQPFMIAARALGIPAWRQLLVHILPNLVGTIVVYATLTAPQAILQESFLSFLGIGVRPPLPSWGNLASDGLVELNRYHSHWWLLLFPCTLLALTLLALNFVGEGLKARLDPKGA